MSHSSKRADINFILNALLFLSLSVITGIGLLIKYNLVPGSQRRLIYGGNVDLFFLGLDRHEWGEIHLIVGYVFFVLSLLHIVLHWKAVVHAYHRILKWPAIRIVIALVFAIICALIIFMPLLVEPEVVKGGSHGEGHAAVIELTDL